MTAGIGMPSPANSQAVGPETPGIMLECVGLTKTFDAVKAVADCSFRMQRGSIRGIIGPNGAGKSTLVSMIAGSVQPDGGSIVFNGEMITRLAPHARARRGLVRTFQLGSEFPRLTVLENLLAAAPGHPGENILHALFNRRSWHRFEEAKVQQALKLLKDFDLIGKRDEYAGNLSGGQRRLLELARALMAEPQLLVLDEPMVGVSPVLRARLVELLRHLREQGVTLVIIEHVLEVIEQLCDQVSVMVAGSVIAEGSMSEMRANKRVVSAYLS